MKQPKTKKLNKRKCVNCGEVFQKLRSLQNTCDYVCAIEHAKHLKEKKEAKEWKDRKRIGKEKQKTKQDYEKDLETIFNKFIRERDKSLPCVSCGAAPNTYKLTAGHFYPAGSYRNLRFDEDNVHGQCWYNCNKNRHGNLQEYRIGIISRIGSDGLQRLDERSRVARHYTIPELIELKVKYKDKIKEL